VILLPRVALAATVVLGVAACRAPDPRPAPRLPPSLLAEGRLLPDDTDAVIQVDLARARTALPGQTGRLARSLARAAAGRLGLALPDAALRGVDRLLVGLTFGPDRTDALALALACGAPAGTGPLVAALTAHHGPAGSTYRSRPLAEHGATAWARLTDRCVAVGAPERVRLAIDLADRVPGRGALAEDAGLGGHWAALVEPAAGQPPVLAVVLRAPPGLQARLARRLDLADPPSILALRLSAGSFLALRARLLAPDRAAATKLIQRLETAARALTPHAARRGLLPLLAALEVHPEGRVVHVQWQVPVAGLDALVPALAAALAGKKR
jgi:hypothetical protein